MSSSTETETENRQANGAEKKRTIADYFGTSSSEMGNAKEIKSSEKGKRSLFWKYFDKIETDRAENEKAICNICKRNISLGGSLYL